MGILQRWREIEGGDLTVAIGASSVQSAALGAQTYAVMISCNSNCHFTFGMNPTATATNFYLKATDPPQIIGCSPGEKIAVIEDSAVGVFYIKQLSQ